MARISIKINLEINRETRDRELELKIRGLKPIIRVFCKIKFEELGMPEDALVDTGAHISLIPFQIWKSINAEIVTEHSMKGVVPDKDIPVNVGFVKAKLIDKDGNESKEIKFLSYLAFTNKVPLILGMRDLLEQFDLYMLLLQNKAYLKEF